MVQNGICSLAPCEKFNIFRHNGRLFSFLNVARERFGAGEMWEFFGGGSQSETTPRRGVVICSAIAQRGHSEKIF